MKRTTVMLPEDLKKMAEREALRQGASLGEIIRTALKALLQPIKMENYKKDSLFSNDLVYKGPVEKDISRNHDEYLY
ncbi:MAG: hypothetical protein H0T62_01445 [Parachlamydiaceae bacterium]|nr:hypothetical protein [Parachlamydiaceae bacterium]